MGDKLISVETQTEHSVTTGSSETRIFVKMYVNAVRDGLIADMGPRNWTTLCVIASFMGSDGKCYPTQSQIAKGLGVSRQSANKYVNDLVGYRWKGKAVVTKVKARNEVGRWENTRYTVLPVSNLEIFDGPQAPMSTVIDSVTADMAIVDTKKN